MEYMTRMACSSINSSVYAAEGMRDTGSVQAGSATGTPSRRVSKVALIRAVAGSLLGHCSRNWSMSRICPNAGWTMRISEIEISAKTKFERMSTFHRANVERTAAFHYGVLSHDLLNGSAPELAVIN